MQHHSSTIDSASRLLMPASLASLVFHISIIVMLGLAMQPWPRGAAVEPGLSTGIVLETASADGDFIEVEMSAVESIAETAQLQAPALLSEAPTDLPVIAPPDFAATPIAPAPATLPATYQNAVPPGVEQFTQGAARRGSPGGNGTAQVSVFGVKGEGKRFLYLFDRSASMDGAPLTAAKRQLLESLAALQDAHQFHIIFFNTRTHSFDIVGGGRRIPFATARNKHLASDFVGAITADGGTDRLTALKQAIAFAPDVIFFLTDADDPMPPSELSEIARDNRAHAAICVIEFGRRQSPSPGNFLSELARQSGGQYGYVNTAMLSPQ
jgi:Ca-activated chloride channel family protein